MYLGVACKRGVYKKQAWPVSKLDDQFGQVGGIPNKQEFKLCFTHYWKSALNLRNCLANKRQTSSHLPTGLGRFLRTLFRSTWRHESIPGEHHGFTLQCVPVLCPGVYRAEQTILGKCWPAGYWGHRFGAERFILSVTSSSGILLPTPPNCHWHRAAAGQASHLTDTPLRVGMLLKRLRSTWILKGSYQDNWRTKGIPVFSKAVYKVPTKTFAIRTVSLIWTNSNPMNHHS